MGGQCKHTWVRCRCRGGFLADIGWDPGLDVGGIPASSSIRVELPNTFPSSDKFGLFSSRCAGINHRTGSRSSPNFGVRARTLVE